MTSLVKHWNSRVQILPLIQILSRLPPSLSPCPPLTIQAIPRFFPPTPLSCQGPHNSKKCHKKKIRAKLRIVELLLCAGCYAKYFTLVITFSCLPRNPTRKVVWPLPFERRGDWEWGKTNNPSHPYTQALTRVGVISLALIFHLLHNSFLKMDFKSTCLKVEQLIEESSER